MIIFSIIAGALALVALLMVSLPLLTSRAKSAPGSPRTELNLSVYRDQLAELDQDRRAGTLDEHQYEQARGELGQRLLEEVPDAEAPAPAPAPAPRRTLATALALSFTVPILALLLYLALGSPASLLPQQGDGEHGVGAQQVDAMIGRLAARLEKNPQDGDGWILLARSHAALDHYGAASSAYAKSLAIYPDNAQLLADYADALAMAQGRSLRGEPEKLIERALRADPNNVKALALAGTIAFDNKDFAAAVNHWERVQGIIPPGSELATSIQASISEAKGLAGGVGRKRP